jgi:hypothetical protein
MSLHHQTENAAATPFSADQESFSSTGAAKAELDRSGPFSAAANDSAPNNASFPPEIAQCSLEGSSVFRLIHRVSQNLDFSSLVLLLITFSPIAAAKTLEERILSMLQKAVSVEVEDIRRSYDHKVRKLFLLSRSRLRSVFDDRFLLRQPVFAPRRFRST